MEIIEKSTIRFDNTVRIPASILKEMGLVAGTKLLVKLENGQIIMEVEK